MMFSGLCTHTHTYAHMRACTHTLIFQKKDGEKELCPALTVDETVF